jgi:hypothetical protein
MNQRLTLLWGFLGFTVLAMIGGTIAVLFPRWQGSDELLGSLILIGLYALGAMAFVIYGKRMPITRWLGLVGLIVSLVFFLVSTWFWRPMNWYWESVVMSVGAISLAIAGGLAHRVFIWPIKPRRFGGAVLKWSAVVFALVTVGMIVFGFAIEGTSYWGRGYLRLMWISVILTTGTTIATGVLALFGPKPEDEEPRMMPESVDVSLRCPVCANDLQIKSNTDGCCSYCNLKIRVDAEELYCGCGYLLYKLQGTVCPECGKEIKAGERWAGDSGEVSAT